MSPESLGAKVGAAVGVEEVGDRDDGSAVGDAVGALDGEALGTCVGEMEGAGDGTKLGMLVGF